ncbi:MULTISPECIES: helix-turn-helix domain-containing protein [Cyanophyceae]|uniref:helix-turn-helix domain-containing protein n=1 Tax=Cyanophyceae TaxID=3028117 RepID=UPI00321F9B50
MAQSVVEVSSFLLIVAPELEKFGEQVRQLRKALGLSQEDLAELTDLHRTYIGGIERGERNVALINIVRLAKALNVSPSELLKGIE